MGSVTAAIELAGGLELHSVPLLGGTFKARVFSPGAANVFRSQAGEDLGHAVTSTFTPTSSTQASRNTPSLHLEAAL